MEVDCPKAWRHDVKQLHRALRVDLNPCIHGKCIACLFKPSINLARIPYPVARVLEKMDAMTGR